jgi:hypothetical protein
MKLESMRLYVYLLGGCGASLCVDFSFDEVTEDPSVIFPLFLIVLIELQVAILRASNEYLRAVTA